MQQQSEAIYLGFDQISAVMVARDKQNQEVSGKDAKGDKNTMIVSLQVAGVRADVGQLQPPFTLASSVSVIDPFGISATGTVEPQTGASVQKLTLVLDAFLQSINARISYQDIKMMLLMGKSFTAVIAQHESVYVREKKQEQFEEGRPVLLSPYLLAERQKQHEDALVIAESAKHPALELNLSVMAKFNFSANDMDSN